MRSLLSTLIAAGCVVGSLGFAAGDAEACSFAPAEWLPIVGDNKLNATAQGPLVIQMEGYTNPFEDLPTLQDSGYTVQIEDVDGTAVSGTLTALGGKQAGLARLVFTPDEPFSEGANYSVTIEGDSEFAGTQTVPLSIGSFTPEVTPSLSAVELRRRGGTEECCEAASMDDYSCIQDSCGDYEHGEECRVCWPTALTFPVSISITDVLADAGPWRAYYRLEVYDVTDAEELVASGEALRGQVEFELPAVPGEERCFELLVQPVVDAGLDSSRSETLCISPGDIETADHAPLDNTEDIARCDAGTFVELGEDGTETPIDDPTQTVDPADGGGGENNGGGNNGMGDPGAGEKAEPGGCQTTSAPASGGLFALLLGFFAFRRRR